MDRLKARLLLFTLLTNMTNVAFATPYYGANIAWIGIPREPVSLHGYQLMGSFDPQCLQWRKFNVYFDAAYSHFWTHDTPYYSNITIYAIAPVVRYTFTKRGPILPYLDLSIGFAYLNRTRIADRNLGIHFSFQDRVGIGMLLGEKRQITLGIQFVHYSNAHLSQHNSGITVPIMFNIGYRLQP